MFVQGVAVMARGTCLPTAKPSPGGFQCRYGVKIIMVLRNMEIL